MKRFAYLIFTRVLNFNFMRFNEMPKSIHNDRSIVVASLTLKNYNEFFCHEMQLNNIVSR